MKRIVDRCTGSLREIPAGDDFARRTDRQQLLNTSGVICER